MKTLELDEAKYSIPENWNEMSSFELAAVVGACNKPHWSWLERKTNILIWFLQASVKTPILHPDGSKGYILITREGRHQITSTQIYNIIRAYLGFLTKENDDGEEQLNCTLTKCPYRNLPCSCHQKPLAPQDRLTNITFEQFTMCQMFALNAAHSKSESSRQRWIDYLVGTLFFAKQEYETFDSRKVDEYYETAKKAGPMQKEVILLFWMGCATFLAEKYKRVFSGTKNTTGREYVNLADQHAELLFALSKGDVTKNGIIDSTNVYDVLKNLELTIKQNEELQRELKKKKKK